MKRILITGGAGFIGQHLMKRLVDDGHIVRVIDALIEQVHQPRPPACLFPRYSSQVDFHQADIRDPEAVAYALHDVDTVVHFAAEVGVGQSNYRIRRYVDTNVTGTAVLLEAMAAAKRRGQKFQKLICAGSMSAYGEGLYRCNQVTGCGGIFRNERLIDDLLQRQWNVRCPSCGDVDPVEPIGVPEDASLQPASVYAITKRDQEELCLLFGGMYHVPTIALRFFNVIGPGQSPQNPYTGVVAIFANHVLQGHAPLVFEDGLQTRDFIHVQDVVEVCMRAIYDQNIENAVINVGTGRPTTVLRVAELICQMLNSNIQPMVLHRYRVGDIRHCFANNSKLAEYLDYRPQITFEDALVDTLEWYKAQPVVPQYSLCRALEELGDHALIW